MFPAQRGIASNYLRHSSSAFIAAAPEGVSLLKSAQVPTFDPAYLPNQKCCAPETLRQRGTQEYYNLPSLARNCSLQTEIMTLSRFWLLRRVVLLPQDDAHLTMKRRPNRFFPHFCGTESASTCRSECVELITVISACATPDMCSRQESCFGKRRRRGATFREKKKFDQKFRPKKKSKKFANVLGSFQAIM